MYLHLAKLDRQGWLPGELRDILLDLLTTGDPRRQQELARRVIALMAERGHDVSDNWSVEKIDAALAWSF